ncbi:MAG: AMP-binding protein [Myxococcota bacterium]
MSSPAPPSVREVDARLCAPGSLFELETVVVDGRPVRAWKNAPRSLGAILDRSREVGGDRAFLVLDDERVSHAEHHERAVRLAAALVDELGVRKGDRVAIAMRNLPEWSIAFFAAGLAGAIAVPLNAFWNGAELAFAIGDCEPRVLIADGERFERLCGHEQALAGVVLVGTRLDDRKSDGPLPAGILAFASLLDRPAVRPQVEVEPDDPATLFYTSGTTSHPKGVIGTHRNVCANVISLQFVGARALLRDGAKPPDGPFEPPIMLIPVPLFHATGCHTGLVGQAWFGGTVVLMRRWNPEVALDLIERERISGVTGVPTMVWDLVNAPSLARRDLRSVRSLGGGGAAAPPELLRRIREVVPNAGSGTGYGMTEASSLATSISGSDYVARPRSVGVPVPVCEVRIVDEDGRPLPVGEVGEIWMRGSTVTLGYWRRPEDTAKTFTEGWLHSGDLGRLDEEGFLYIVDRAKDMVIRGGENVSSLEVEAALFEHPSVLEAAVFSVPHPTLGEEVGAVVRLREGATLSEEALRAHAAARLAPFKVPAHVFWTDEPLPRGATGKIQKREIKARFLASSGTPSGGLR